MDQHAAVIEQTLRLRAIIHASIPRYACRDNGHSIAPSNAKMVLFVVAMHEGERITLVQLGRLCGLSYQPTVYAVATMLDHGLIRRVEPRRGVAKFPRRHRGKAYAYEVNWSAVGALPQTNLVPPSALRQRRHDGTLAGAVAAEHDRLLEDLGREAVS